MLPICVKCRTEMRCIKNSVAVAHEDTSHHQRSADMYGCDPCGTKVLAGFGAPVATYATDADILIHDPKPFDARPW